MTQQALTGLVAVMLLGTQWAFQNESDWVNVLAPTCVAAAVVQVGLIIKGLLARRD